MNVLFDNCTSPVMARTLHGFISGDGHRAIHMRDLPLHHPSDIQWINYIKGQHDEWLVITGDDRIRRNKAERAAFRQAKLKAVVLATGFQKAPMNKRCATIVHQWPDLLETIQRIDPPFMLEMRLNWGSKLGALSL
jgi:predicted nuclease of predicted toxin-antitoxin system